MAGEACPVVPPAPAAAAPGAPVAAPAPDARHRRAARLVVAGVALVAFLGAARSLQVGHLSDDWAILSHVSRHGNAEAWTGPWLGMRSLRFHRPIFTGLYDLDLRLFGVDPFPAHLHHVLWHVAAAALLVLVLQALGSPLAGAAFGGVAFAIHPYLPGATGWLAGRCGTVAGTFTLLVLYAALRFGKSAGPARAAWYAGALLAAVAAALTRESGYLALTIPLAVDLVLARPRPSRPGLVRRQVPFAIAGVLLLLLRLHALGTVAGGYPVPQGLMAGAGAAGETFRTFGEALLRLFGGIEPEFLQDRYVLPVALGASTLATLLIGSAAVRRRHPELGRGLALLALLFGLQGLLLLVAGPTLAPSTGQRWYAAIAFFCGALGLAAAPLLTRERLFAPLLLLPALVAGHVVVQDELLAADQDVKRIIASVQAEIRAAEEERKSWDPGARGPIIISCLPESRIGLPTLQWGFAEALRPPFQEQPPPRPVYPIHRFMYLGQETLYPLHPPVEALLHVQGKVPLALGMADPWNTITSPIQAADIGALVDQLGPVPPKWHLFYGEVLPLLEPTGPRTKEHEVRGAPLAIRLRVDARGCEAIEFFSFLPTIDRRDLVHPVDGIASIDLGPLVEDFIAFRGEPMRLYVVPVGYRQDSPARPMLGHLTTFLCVP